MQSDQDCGIRIPFMKMTRRTSGMSILMHAVFTEQKHELAGTFANLIHFLFILISNQVALEICRIRSAFVFIEPSGNLPTNCASSGRTERIDSAV